jgi:hypothetical protein
LPTAPSSPSTRAALAILCLAIGGAGGVLPSLAAPDLAWCYPYMGPDSWDWLVNGLFWSGAPLAASHRPPGLPLAIALLHRLQALPLLPFLNFAMLGLAAVLLHRLVRLRHTALVAALAVLLFVSNGSLFGYTRFVMAEVWTLPFLLAAALAFYHAEGEPRRYVPCALLLSLSFLFHYTGAIVGLAFVLAMLLHRRAALATRWPWIALLAALPLPALWLVVRAQHDRATRNIHDVERLVQPSFDNLWYYAVVATALLGIVVVPLYLLGFLRLAFVRDQRDPRRAPWVQAVLYPLVALGLFFTLIYHWADKRFLYYLFPFAIAVAAESLATLLQFARGGRLRAAGVMAVLALMLLWNRIPYPAATHRLLALSPREFVDAAGGRPGTRLRIEAPWSDLLTTDGFASWKRPAASCAQPEEQAATPALRVYLATHLAPDQPVALLTGTADPGIYWSERNHFAAALERPVVKPDEARFAVRLAGVPGPPAIASFGPFAVVDLQAPAAGEKQERRRRHKRPRNSAR